MNKYDYSIYYKLFHDESETHADKMSDWLSCIIKPHLNLPKDARILDVGCGFGFALGALRKLGYENTLGLELSPEQADVARKAGHRVIVTDDSIGWMLSHPQQFDYVVLLDVLEHLPVEIQIDFLRALHAVLRPGGKVIITVPNANAILNARWRYNDYTHHSSFTDHSLFFVLRNAGFESIWIDSSKGLGRFSLRFWRRSFWPSVRRWIVRWCWLQVFKAEFPDQNIDPISFEINLTAVAAKNA